MNNLHNNGYHGERPSVDINSELKDIFNPLCFAIADGVRQEIASGNAAKLLEEGRPQPSLSLPSGTEYYRLPWDTFLGLSATEIAEIQRTEDWDRIDTIKSDYLNRHPEIDLDDGNGFPSPELMAFNSALDDHIFGWPSGTSKLNPEDWKEYEAGISTLSSGDQDRVAIIQRNRYGVTANFSWHSPVMAQTPTVLYGHNAQIDQDTIISDLVIPVGEYGEVFARSLLGATTAIQTYAEANIYKQAAEATAGHEDTLSQFTARAAYAGGAEAKTTMQTVQEGLLSILQSIALLTNQKVRGYEDNPQGLVDQLVKSGLVERLSRYAPMGFVGPMSMSGNYYPNCVEPNETGGLRFSQDFEVYLKEQRTRYVSEHVAEYALRGNTIQEPHPSPIGRICPVSGKDGGIQQITDSFTLLLAAANK